MSLLILVLSAIAISLLSGAGVYAICYLVAESVLFEPLRQGIAPAASSISDRLNLTLQGSARITQVSVFLSALIQCPYCLAWWHAAWLTPVVVLLADGPLRLALLAYLPTVGVTLLIIKLTYRAPPPRSRVQDMLADLT